MRRALSYGVAASCLALGWAIASTPAFAQTEADQATEGEIIVTAQRREQALQDTPVAVTALSESALEQLNVSSTQDLMQIVPSLQVSTQTAGDSGGSATFFLRGMGQQRSANGSEPAVGIYVDDFYYPSLSGAVFDVIDLAQVEVLRGPQGTLFGRNTIGGAIRYTTRGPELGEFSGHATGTLGQDERADISGSINVPLGDIAALRVTAGRMQQDGYVRVQTGGDDAGGTTTDLVRVQARIEPTNNFYADLSTTYSRFHLDGFGYNTPGPFTPTPPGPGGSPTLPFIYNAVVAPAAGLPLYTDAYRSTCFYCQYGTSSREFSTTTYRNVLATLGWEINDSLSLKSLTGWQLVESRSGNDLDATPLPILSDGISRGRTEAFSQELQLNGELIGDRLNFVSGAFYYKEEQPGLMPERATVVLGAPNVTTSLSDRELTSYAAYFDGSFQLTENFSLLGGMRYSQDQKEVLVRPVPAGAPLADADATFDSTTYRIGAQYAWSDDIMTYFNVSTGFRGGGFNAYDAAQSPPLRSFDPEESTSYELGARTQFLDRRITFNPTVFYVNWDAIQVQAVGVDSLGNVIVSLQNAGTARSYGLELEWSAAVTDHVRLFGSLAYLDIAYTDLGSATGITLDSELQRAPPYTFAIGGAHTLELSSGAEIVSTLNYSFQDDQSSTPTDADALLLRAYDLLSGRIEFTSANDRLRVAIYGTNLLDEEYAVGGVNYYANVGTARYDLGRPREFGVTARVNF